MRPNRPGKDSPPDTKEAATNTGQMSLACSDRETLMSKDMSRPEGDFWSGS